MPLPVHARLAAIAVRFSLLAAGVCAPMSSAQPAASPPAATSVTGSGITGRVLRHATFPSSHVAARNVDVWLPPSYDASDGGTRRYPVLYVHDGQNQFDPSTSYTGVDWGIDEAMTELLAVGAAEPAIVVAVWNTPRRRREYVPDVPLTAAQETVMGPGPTRSPAYVRFLTDELKPFIDRTYRTRTERAATSVMGSSMGGLISLYALTEYPEVFGAAGCVSTHWPMLIPKEGEALSDADVDAVTTAFEGYLKAALPRPGRHRIWFDHGTETLDRHYGASQKRIDRLMRAQGWREGRDWISRNFPGAAHNEDAWRARVHLPLVFLLPPKGR